MTRQEFRHYWRLKVEQFKTSNQTAIAFCREQELNYAQFLRWRKKFYNSTTDTFGIFEELSSSPAISLCCGTLKIEVDTAISDDSLTRVIKALCHAAELPR